MKRSKHHLTAFTDRPPSSRFRQRPILAAVATAGVVSLAVAAIAGCGSSASTGPTPLSGPAAASAVQPAHGTSPGTQTIGTSRENTAAAVAPAMQTNHGVGRPKVHHRGATPNIINGNPVRKPAPGTGGDTLNDERRAGKASAADAGSTNPCSLVTRAQAQSLVHAPVAAPELAPLGPTCVYHELGSRAQVTMAVESALFSKLQPHIRQLSRFTVAGRTAYCGVYGTPVAYVLLPANRMLTIVAACDVATKFAAAAVPKLGY